MLVPDRWYAVQVRPRFERVVGRLLAEKSYEPLVPLYKCRRRWSDRVKVLERPLFAGYVLCRVTRDASN
ncbi:MAG: transcription termination/antitermination NusG family protein, partial [Vicinamibacterales bacterium]